MNVKTIVWLIVISIIRNHNDVQCTQSIDRYLALDYNNIENYNLKCYHTIYVILSKELYRLKLINNQARTCYPVGDVTDFDQEPTDNFLISIFDSYITLLRICNLDKWTENTFKNKHILLYNKLHALIHMHREYYKKDIVPIASHILELGSSNGHLNFKTSDNENIMKTYESCESTLLLMSNSSIIKTRNYVLQQLAMRRKINALDHGYILLLLNESEYEHFENIRDNTDKRAVVLLGLMKDALANIMYGMCRVLGEINIDNVQLESFNNSLENDHPNGEKLKLLKSMYPHVIDAADLIYGITADNDSYYKNQKKIRGQSSSNIMEAQHEIYEEPFYEYKHFVTYFSLKWIRMCQNCVEDYYIKHSHYKLKTLNSSKETALGYLNNVKFVNFIDRLTTFDEHNKLKVIIPVYQYYGILHEDLNEKVDQFDEEITFLMELNVWIILLQEYSYQMYKSKGFMRIINIEDLTNKKSNYQSIKPLYDLDRLLLSGNIPEMMKAVKNDKERERYRINGGVKNKRKFIINE